MAIDFREKRLSDEERREFLKVLGVAGAIATGGSAIEEVSLADLRDAVALESAAGLSKRGEAIRNEVSGDLDASILATGLDGVAGAIERLPEIQASGLPEAADGATFERLTDPAWAVEEHLAEVGFFGAAEENLPLFSADHIASATKELIRTEALASTLADIGFSDRERTAMVANAVANNAHLSRWAPVRFYEETDVEDVVSAYVPPLHRRAAGGVLLWIDGLDRHLAQNRVLVTDDLLARGLWDVKAMLGGFYLLTAAAEGLAREDIPDGQLTALLTGSTAIMIISQMDLKQDLVYITDDMRAPRTGGE